MENKLAKWICRRLRAKQVVDEEYEEVEEERINPAFASLKDLL